MICRYNLYIIWHASSHKRKRANARKMYYVKIRSCKLVQSSFAHSATSKSPSTYNKPYNNSSNIPQQTAHTKCLTEPTQQSTMRTMLYFVPCIPPSHHHVTPTTTTTTTMSTAKTPSDPVLPTNDDEAPPFARLHAKSFRLKT